MPVPEARPVASEEWDRHPAPFADQSASGPERRANPDAAWLELERLNSIHCTRGMFVEFIFRITAAEKAEVLTNRDHLRPLRFSPSLPYAFTEHRAIMLASLLNSPIAVQASVQVARAFVSLREMLASHKDLARTLEELEKKCDAQFRVVFDGIRELMEPPPLGPRRRSIGFRVEEARPHYRIRRR